ncbi:hypothetical protein [Methylobacter sp.]|uniref:hypothetical protein n=1 Tax=Methylobacter sp. TaxID=2051955 RepID=UPI003DA406FC
MNFRAKLVVAVIMSSMAGGVSASLISTYQANEPTGGDAPDIKMAEVDTPDIPDVNTPDVDTPDIPDIPDVDAPDTPDIPDVDTPDAPDITDVNTPDADTPD